MKRKPAVLVVDDEPIQIDILYELLKGEYRIQAAHEGATALEIIRKSPPELVILDRLMPGLDGDAVLEAIRDKHSSDDLPVIVLTGKETIRDETEGLRRGANDYLVKPVNADLLRARVHNQFELKMARDNLKSRLEHSGEKLKQTEESLVQSMAMLALLKDNETGAHVFRIREYARVIARALQNGYPKALSDKNVERLVRAAPLHDIGKVGVPDEILNQEGPLNPEQWAVMRSHTTMGAELLERLMKVNGGDPILAMGRDIALCHHENWDGTGYPRGLKRGAIPMAARIIKLADVYDALVSERPYKKTFSHQQALDIIRYGDDRTRPEHFWPVLIRLLDEIHPELRRIHSYVSEDSGELLTL